MKDLRLVGAGLLITLLFVIVSINTLAKEKNRYKGKIPELVVEKQWPEPVLTVRSPDARGNKYGFEGGRVVKFDGNYHMFTAEMVDDPIWVKMKLAHWRSKDRENWTRVGTLFESSGEFSGKDPRASLWAPIPIFDEVSERWNLFYVAYRSAPNTPSQFRLDHDGHIWRAVSETPGLAGISGPYSDVSVVLEPGFDSEPWEGLQGTDSFFPFRVGHAWFAFYSSANTETLPIKAWRVGLATAPDLTGPWFRRSDLNPVPIEPVFIENPLVTRLDNGSFICVYDNMGPDSIGWATSEDGWNWSSGHSLNIQPDPGKWSADVRTPLGLVPESGDNYSLFYTGFEGDPNWEELMRGNPRSTCAVGLVTVRIQWKKPAKKGKK